jgi:hypothetical protein
MLHNVAGLAEGERGPFCGSAMAAAVVPQPDPFAFVDPKVSLARCTLDYCNLKLGFEVDLMVLHCGVLSTAATNGDPPGTA